jgi:hypothetical protein
MVFMGKITDFSGRMVVLLLERLPLLTDFFLNKQGLRDIAYNI